MVHARFVCLDIHKELISVAVTVSGRVGAIEYHGEVANGPGAISKLCRRLGRPGKQPPAVFHEGRIMRLWCS
jgi:transposase